jgi:hypothetical protein
MNDFARRLAAGIAVAILAAGLAACGSERKARPCPQVRVDAATASMTKFRDGPGRATGDIEYQVEIVGFKGQCIVDDEEFEVVMDMDLAIARGPAGNAGSVPISYFVAIPQLFPKPEGKKVFDVKYSLPGKAAAPQRLRETNIRVKIALEKDQTAAAYDIYLGLQITPEQLEYNRAQPRG